MSGGWDDNVGIGSWIDKDRWNARAKPRIAPPGTRVVLGFGGGNIDNWTGIRLETLDGYQFTPTYGPDERPTIWNPADFDGRVPRLEVDAAMDEVMRTYNVVRAYMDPPYWEAEVDIWADRFGDQCVIRWCSQRTTRTHAAAERLATDVTKKDSTFTHDGCATTSAHVSNARKATRPGSRYVLRKASVHQKIDLGMCSLLAHEAAGDARPASPRQPYVETPRLRPHYRPRASCRSALTWAIRYAISEPRDAAYCAFGRLSCRLGQHNTTCRGRIDHRTQQTRQAR